METSWTHRSQCRSNRERANPHRYRILIITFSTEQTEYKDHFDLHSISGKPCCGFSGTPAKPGQIGSYANGNSIKWITFTDIIPGLVVVVEGLLRQHKRQHQANGEGGCEVLFSSEASVSSSSGGAVLCVCVRRVMVETDHRNWIITEVVPLVYHTGKGDLHLEK